MAQEIIEYKVLVDTSTGKVAIEGLTNKYIKASTALNKLKAEIEQTNKALGQGASSSGLAGAAVVELGRLITDFNYGITAMANNLTQLASLFAMLSVSLGGAREALKSMREQLRGPLGYVIAFQVLVTVIEGAWKAYKAHNKAVKESTEALKKKNKELKVTKTRWELATKALNEYIKSLGILAKVRIEESNYVATNISRLKILLRQVREATDGSDRQRLALQKLREEYGLYYKDISDADIIKKSASAVAAFRETETAIKDNGKAMKSLEGYDETIAKINELKTFLKGKEEAFNKAAGAVAVAEKALEDYKKIGFSPQGIKFYQDEIERIKVANNEILSNYRTNQKELDKVEKERGILLAQAGVYLTELGVKIEKNTESNKNNRESVADLNATNEETLRQLEELASAYESTSKDENISINERIKANVLYAETLVKVKEAYEAVFGEDIRQLNEEIRIEDDANKKASLENELQALTDKRDATIAAFDNQIELVKSNEANLVLISDGYKQAELDRELAFQDALAEIKANEITNEVDRLTKLKELHDQKAETDEQALLDDIAATEEGTQAREAALDDHLKWQIAREQEFSEDEKAIAAATAAEVIATEEAKHQKRAEGLERISKGLGAVGMAFEAFSNMAEKDSKKQKKLAAAGAIIDTLSAIVGQLSAFKKVPIPGYAIAQAIATGAFGFANVKKILATDPTGGTSSSSLQSPPPAPTFNIVGTTGSSQLKEAVERGMEKPVKAYVTQKDINSSAEFDRNVRQTSAVIG